MKLVGCVFVTVVHQAALMVVAANLSEFFRCLSEILGGILLFLYFILDNNCSQMYILPNSSDVNKVGS
mgnify:CR=1 FL=1